MMDVEEASKGPVQTNIGPCLQEQELATRPIEELVEIQVDTKEPSRFVKIGKGLESELAQQPVGFLHEN